MIQKLKRIRRYAQTEVQKVIREGLGWAYGSPEGWKQRALIKPLYSLNRFAMLTDRASLGQVFVSQGISTETGEPWKVGFVGNWASRESDSFLALYEGLFFQEGTAQTTRLGDIHVSEARRVGEKLATEVDLLAVNGNELHLWRPDHGDWVSGPSYLRMSFRFQPGESWKEVEKRIGQEYNLRVLRKNGLTYRNSCDEADFQRFYHEQYIPLIKNRYGEGGAIMPEHEVHNIFKLPGGSVLIIETPEGEVIGGGLENLWRGTLYAILNGVTDGRQDYIKKGALSGWYYFSMKRAHEHGCSRFDSGMCNPFLTDGVYIHKHRWGQSPSLDYWSPLGLLLWAPNSSPAALAWLRAHPMHPNFARLGGENLCDVYDQALQQVAAM